MKGLLLKDVYLSWRYCRGILLLIVIFLALSFVGDGNLFFLVYPMMVAGLVPVTLLGYDERDRWLAYSGTLPYTRAQLVSVKYLMGLCGGAISFLLVMATTVVQMKLSQTFSWTQLSVVSASLLALGVLAPAFMLPFLFKYGAEKGRFVFAIALGLFYGVVSFLIIALGDTIVIHPWVLWVAAGVSVVLYALSWLLSIRCYQKRTL